MPFTGSPGSALTTSPLTLWRPIMADNEESLKSVGYKRPPRHTQFKPGMSGNIKGRPKGAKNFATVIDQELGAKIEVTENGRRRRISKREAIVKQTVNKAAGGDPKATVIVLNEARLNESQNQSPVAQSAFVSPEEQVVMDSIVRRISQSNPASPAADPHCDPRSDGQPSPQCKEGEL
jgi:hypothetical protein